jgi:hypothetical protein
LASRGEAPIDGCGRRARRWHGHALMHTLASQATMDTDEHDGWWPLLASRGGAPGGGARLAVDERASMAGGLPTRLCTPLAMLPSLPAAQAQAYLLRPSRRPMSGACFGRGERGAASHEALRRRSWVLAVRVVMKINIRIYSLRFKI